MCGPQPPLGSALSHSPRRTGFTAVGVLLIVMRLPDAHAPATAGIAGTPADCILRAYCSQSLARHATVRAGATRLRSIVGVRDFSEYIQARPRCRCSVDSLVPTSGRSHAARRASTPHARCRICSPPSLLRRVASMPRLAPRAAVPALRTHGSSDRPCSLSSHGRAALAKPARASVVGRCPASSISSDAASCGL